MLEILLLGALSGTALAIWLWRQFRQKKHQAWQALESGDAEQLEQARDSITPAQVVQLIQQYWQESDWEKKQQLVTLLQDQTHPDLQPLMLDFLRIPTRPLSEEMELAQAIALGFIDEAYDHYTEYYNDRARLARDVQAVLAAHGIAVAEAPKPQNSPAPVKPTPLPSTATASEQLLFGIAQNNLALVQQALSAGADMETLVTEGNYTGCSALLLAMAQKRFEIATYLMAQGANIHFTRSDLDEKFVQGRGQSPLWWAANHGNLPLTQELIQRGAYVDTPDHHGGTPLTCAASDGHLEVVRYLVESGADIFAKISDGRTAFHLAVTEGHTEVVRYLLQAGNDPNKSGGSGYSPLMVAAEKNFYEMAELLIQHGANVNAVHPGKGIYTALRGWTPLTFAIHAGMVRMTKLLISAGANPHYRVPPAKHWNGSDLPERSLLEFAKGKRAESIRALLEQLGVKP